MNAVKAASKQTTASIPPATAGPSGRVGGDRSGVNLGKGLAPLVAALCLVVVAAIPRLIDLATYVTIDESRWVQRAADFQALLAQGDPEDTFIIGHPGVTTMWTAFLGMGPERARRFSFLEGRTDVTLREGYLEALVAARWPFALIAAAGVGIVTLIGWRLLGAGPAITAGLLLALDPFLIAHARVAHLDSSLTLYTSICLLAALVWAQGGGIGFVVLSGLAGGLAFLTKAPSVYTLGFVPLAVAVYAVRQHGWRPRRLARTGLLILLWGLVALAICLVLWPALRANPVGTLLKMVQFTERVGGGEHDNFFMGQPREDPGPFFYPLALLYRITPLVAVGLALVVACWRWLSPVQRRTTLTLAAYGLGFGLMMSMAPKKFDRYLLPIFPSLTLVAGLGLWLAFRNALVAPLLMLGRRAGAGPVSIGELATTDSSRPRQEAVRTFVGLSLAFGLSVLALQLAPLLATAPYYLAYYNPLLGGGGVAQRVILVGWGEGLDQVAHYLNGQTRLLGEPTVATSYHRVLQAHLEGSALPLERVRMADYVVPYVNTLQRDAEREVLAPFLDGSEPELVVRINGIEYARVYRGPHYPSGGPVGVELGGRIGLVEFLAAPGSGVARAGEEIQVQLRWDRPPSGDERAAVLLRAADGRTVVDDERSVGADGPDEAGRPGEIHRLTIPSRALPGEYQLVVQVTDPRARTVVPITRGPGVGEHSVVLRQVTVEAPPR